MQGHGSKWHQPGQHDTRFSNWEPETQALERKGSSGTQPWNYLRRIRNREPQDGHQLPGDGESSSPRSGTGIPDRSPRKLSSRQGAVTLPPHLPRGGQQAGAMPGQYLSQGGIDCPRVAPARPADIRVEKVDSRDIAQAGSRNRGLMSGSPRLVRGTGSPRLRNDGNSKGSYGWEEQRDGGSDDMSSSEGGGYGLRPAEGHRGTWGSMNRSDVGSGMAGEKPDLPRTRGVSRRTTKKIHFFEPVDAEPDLLSDDISQLSYSSVGSTGSSKNLAPRSHSMAEVGNRPPVQIPSSRSFPLRSRSVESLPDASSYNYPMDDPPDTFTDTGSGPDTATDTTSIATMQEYLSGRASAASATHILYKRSKSPAAEMAEELLMNSHMFGKLQIPNFDACDPESTDPTHGSSISMDAEDDAYEYSSIVERLQQAERGLVTPLSAVREVRAAAKHSELARKALSEAGAIPPLLRLLMPDHDMGTRHTAALALLNLAIGCTRNKLTIYEEGGVPLLIDLLRPQSFISLRESATAVILSLAASDTLKPHLEAAIPHLVDVLKNGTTQGRSDACRALLNLSIFKPHRQKIVHAGAIAPLYVHIQRDFVEAGDKGVLLLSHLYMTQEGRDSVAAAPETFSVLLHALKAGSQSAKEQAAGILLSLTSDPEFRQKTMAAQGILPALVEMALLGSPKAQQRASRLLELMKNHRNLEGVALVDPEADKASKSSKPRRRRATSLSGVEELASKVKEAEVAAAVEVVASAIEGDSSPDDTIWPDNKEDVRVSASLRASGAVGPPLPVPATDSKGANDKKTKTVPSGGRSRRGSSFSGGWGSTKDKDIDEVDEENMQDPEADDAEPRQPATPGRTKTSKGGMDPSRKQGKSSNILLSLRSLWTRRWDGGCKAAGVSDNVLKNALTR